MWHTVFGVTNIVALAAWAVLILLPRKPLPLAFVMYGGVGLLCLAYSAMFVALLGSMTDPGIGPGVRSYSVDGLKDLFRSDGAVVLGWTHFLALDLFAGLWIARDADAKDFGRGIQAPFLILTLFAGPLGLLTWLALRERRARARGWHRKGKMPAG